MTWHWASCTKRLNTKPGSLNFWAKGPPAITAVRAWDRKGTRLTPPNSCLISWSAATGRGEDPKRILPRTITISLERLCPDGILPGLSRGGARQQFLDGRGRALFSIKHRRTRHQHIGAGLCHQRRGVSVNPAVHFHFAIEAKLFDGIPHLVDFAER